VLSGGHREAILRVVSGQPGIHASGIGRTLGVHHASVGWSARKLVEQGLVEERRVGRRRCFALTSQGEEALRTMEAPLLRGMPAAA
jgi:DNA-binding MarR family transcriptional regulator